MLLAIPCMSLMHPAHTRLRCTLLRLQFKDNKQRAAVCRDCFDKDSYLYTPLPAKGLQQQQPQPPLRPLQQQLGEAGQLPQRRRVGVVWDAVAGGWAAAAAYRTPAGVTTPVSARCMAACQSHLRSSCWECLPVSPALLACQAFGSTLMPRACLHSLPAAASDGPTSS